MSYVNLRIGTFYVEYLVRQKIDALADLPGSQSLCQRDIPTRNKSTYSRLIIVPFILSTVKLRKSLSRIGVRILNTRRF